jgi:hypothetical protein
LEIKKIDFTVTRLPHIPKCSLVTLLQSTSHTHSTTFVLTRSRDSKLLFVPDAEIHDGWLTLEYPRNFARGAACNSTKSIPAMLPKLAKTLGAVY